MDWELLDHEGCATPTNHLAPPLQSSPLITTLYFSINPPTPPTSHSSSSSTDFDRNFDDSYLSNHLLPFLHSPHQHHQPSSSPAPSSNILPLSHDSDSVSDSMPPTVLPQTPTEDLLLDAQAAAGGGALDSHVKEEKEEEKKKNNEEKEVERRAVWWWWKVPLEVFKYWVVRVSPVSVWSLSVAAAAASFLGLVILGRRLYKMKRKTQTLKRNVALDDKVSQLMGRVARLNEAFSVVRRVPIVPTSLPAPPSVTLRPVVIIR